MFGVPPMYNPVNIDPTCANDAVSFLNHHATVKQEIAELTEAKKKDSPKRLYPLNCLIELLPYSNKGIATNIETWLIHEATLKNKLSLSLFIILSKIPAA